MNAFKIILTSITLLSEVALGGLANPYVVNPIKGSYLMSPHLEIFKDKSGSLTPEQILQNELSERFQLNRVRKPHYRWSRSAYWVRYQLNNPVPEQVEKRIHFDYQFVDSLTTYQLTDNKLKCIQATGQHYPFKDRKEKYRRFSLPITLEPESETVFYHRIRSTEVITIPIELSSPDIFLLQEQKKSFGLGMFYGISIIFCLLNFILSAWLKNLPLFFYGMVLLFSHILFTMGRHGLTQMYLFQSLPVFATLCHLTFTCLGQIFSLLLTPAFLGYNISKKKYLQIPFYIQLTALSITAVLPYIIGYQFATKVTVVLTHISILMIIGICIIRVKEDRKIAPYFLIGWLFHLAGAATILGDASGLLKNYFLVNHGYQTGLTLELFMLSLGMIRIFSIQRKQKLLAREQALKAENEAMKSLKQSINSQLKELQAKINPHFLYNSLNFISEIAPRDIVKTRKALELLSDFFRTQLAFANKDLVTLEQEMQFLEQYTAIQTLRYGPRVRYVQEVDPDLFDIKIPGMTLQLLVENAIKHGLLNKDNGGTVTVRAERIEDCVKLSVIDDGYGWNEDGKKSGHGIFNIEKRLKLLYGENYILNIFENNGVTVEIILKQEVPVHV